MTKWTKETIQRLLETNDKAVGRALLVLYANQTDYEKQIQDTRVLNGKGFTGADARVGSSMAQFFNQRGYLTPKQLAYWRKLSKKGTTSRIGKYWNQILIEIEKRGKTVDSPTESSIIEE